MNPSQKMRRLILSGIVLASIGTGCSGNSGGAQAAEVPLDTSTYQQELLAGGVTYAEYERAVLDTISCIESKGVKVLGPFSENGGLSLSFDYGGFPDDASQEQLARAGASVDECLDEYLTAVEDAYYETLQPTEAEFQARELARRRCAQDLGYDTPDDMASGEFYSLVTGSFELSQCIDRYP